MASYEKIHDPRQHSSEAYDNSDAESIDSIEDLRTSTEVRRHDQQIIDDDEEIEKLLAPDETRSGVAGLFKNGKKVNMDQSSKSEQTERKEQKRHRREDREERKDARRQRRRRRRGNEEEGGLLYEMEEGGHRDSSESSGNSSEVDRQKLKGIQLSHKASRPRYGRLAGIHIVIIIAFIILVYGAYRASQRGRPPSHAALTLSNGTSSFAPTTILISLDGFRADFLHRNLTPHLNALVQDGISPPWMLPSFPSVTFPNHFTLVTGLYPESHGIVGNTFWDPDMEAEFYYTDPERSMQPKWWNAEPVWETLEKDGVRTAVHMWPGSEAHIGSVEPVYVDMFNAHEPLSNKVDRILGLLDTPGPGDISASLDTPRPQLIAAYVPNVDADGHLYGPNSTEIRKTIQEADAMIGAVVGGLEDRNLTNIVNVIVVSDHGMATTDTTRLIELDSIIDMSLIEHTDGWPLYGLRPKSDADIDLIYERLKEEARTIGNFEVYLKDKNMPERYHFSNNDRIAPLWMVPQTGWAIVRKHEYDEAMEAGAYHPRGLHGYDHEHPLMRAIFVAHGPAFPHTPGSKMEVFQNIEVYNIVCDSVGVTPRPNNGTLRLPLKPVGVHESPPPGEIPNDSALPATAGHSSSTSDTAVAEATRPVVQDGANDDKDDEEDVNLWWDWVHGKLDAIKDWGKGLLDKVKDKGDGSSAEPTEPDQPGKP